MEIRSILQGFAELLCACVAHYRVQNGNVFFVFYVFFKTELFLEGLGVARHGPENGPNGSGGTRKQKMVFRGPRYASSNRHKLEP